LTEIRYRHTNVYINDLASTSKKVPEAVFAFTLEEIQALLNWVPTKDAFYDEVVEAAAELERRRDEKTY